MCWRISCVAFFPGGLHAKDRPGGLSTGLGNLLRETPARPAATPYFATARGGSCPKWSSANLRIPGGECVYTARRSGGQIERCCAPNPLPRHSPAPTAQTLSGRRAAPGRDWLPPPPPPPRVPHQHALEFERADAVVRRLEHVVHTTYVGDVTVFVAGSEVACVVVTVVHRISPGRLNACLTVAEH